MASKKTAKTNGRQSKSSKSLPADRQEVKEEPAATPSPVKPPEVEAEPWRYRPIHPDGSYDGRTGQSGAERCITAAELVVREHEWLWPGYIAKGLMNLVAGDTAAGKSTIIAAIAAAVSAGREMCGRGGHPPGRVLLYAAEDDAGATIRPRLFAAKADLSRVNLGGIGPGGKPLPRLSLPTDIAKLRNRINDMRISLLILDPITAYLSGGIDANKDQQVGSLLDGLVQLADETACTLIITKNYRKSREGGPLDWVGGAPKWTQIPRVVLACGFDPDNLKERVMAVSKNTLMPNVRSMRYEIRDIDGVGAWAGGAKCDLTAEDLGAAGMTPGERDALGDAVAFLLDALTDEEQKADWLNSRAEDAGISRGTLRRAKAKLGITSHPCGPNGSREWFWRIPAQDGPKQAPASA